jgi:outer membrane receptor protein involved in Fe transport
MKTRPDNRIVAVAFGLSLCPLIAAAQATAPATPAEVVHLSPFNVNVTQDKGYGSSSAMGASRIAIPLIDVPSTVVILNEQFLRDRAAIDAPEALTYVSGVQVGADALPGLEVFSLRGFVIGGIGMRDGLPDPFAATDQPYDESSSYERIEVIKGPAGTLYGAQNMGGIVNKVSKWPKFHRETKVEVNAQSYDQFFRAMLDATGPLTDRLAYRLVLSTRKGERYYDEGDAPNDFSNFTGAATYLLGKRGDAGKIWARGQYLDLSLDRDNGWQFMTGFLNPLTPTLAPLVTNPKMALPVESNTVPEDDISEGTVRSFEAGFERTLNGVLGGNWTTRFVGRASKGTGDKSPSYAQGRPVPVDAGGAIVRFNSATGVLTNGDNRFIAADDPRVADWRATLSLRDFRGFNKARGGFVDLVGDLKTGPLDHKLVLSASITTTVNERAFFFWGALNPSNTTAVANTFSAVKPTPAGVTATSIIATAPKQFNAFQGHNKNDGHAYAVQDNVSFLDNRLILALGARHDDAQITNDRFHPTASLTANAFVVDPALRTVADSAADTFKYGVVGKPIKGLSLFAQHSETFTPITSLGPTGSKNPDQEGESDEVGLKIDLLGGRLIGTFTYFDMQLTNVLLSVLNPPELGGGFVLRPVGVQRTDGFEFDVSAEPFSGFNLLASYSKLTSLDENNRYFRGVPRDANYSLAGRYNITTGGYKGAYIGASWKHSGSFAGDATNTFFLPDNDVIDAFVGYNRKRWGLQVNVYNLTDADEVLSTVSDQLAVRIMGMRYRITFRYMF